MVSRRDVAGGKACGALLQEDSAQGTLEYAVVMAVFVSMVLALGALWRIGIRGGLLELVEEATSHALDASGFFDIALF